MLDWKSELGQNIVEYVDSLRADGMRNWSKIAERVNDFFYIDFHSDKIRKGWRVHGKHNTTGGIFSDHSASFEATYNTGTATSKGKTIKTLDDLIAACEINLNEWKIDKHVVNKWDVKAKSDPVFPLFQVKAWLSRITAVDTKFPVVEPVKFDMPKIQIKSGEKKKMRAAVIIPDSQIGFRKNVYDATLTPFHDREALDLTLQIINHVKPDRVVLLGDMLDLPDWSDKFLRSPEFYFTTQPSLVELAWLLSKIRLAVPEADIDYIEGNHESRMRKMMINHLLSAYDLKQVGDMRTPPAMGVANLLCLDDMNINYYDEYPKDEVWINKKLRCRHGNLAKKGGGSTSRAILRDTFVSEIYGHSHRFEYTCKTIKTQAGMETFHVFSPGTVARIDGSVPSNSAQEDWQQGIGVVYYDEDRFSIVPVSINNGECMFDNMAFIGSDYSEELSKSTGWKF